MKQHIEKKKTLNRAIRFAVKRCKFSVKDLVLFPRLNLNNRKGNITLNYCLFIHLRKPGINPPTRLCVTVWTLCYNFVNVL